MAKANNNSSDDDIKVGVNVMQPTEEKITILGSIKVKVPKLVRQTEKSKQKSNVKEAKKSSASKGTVKKEMDDK